MPPSKNPKPLTRTILSNKKKLTIQQRTSFPPTSPPPKYPPSHKLTPSGIPAVDALQHSTHPQPRLLRTEHQTPPPPSCSFSTSNTDATAHLSDPIPPLCLLASNSTANHSPHPHPSRDTTPLPAHARGCRLERCWVGWRCRLWRERRKRRTRRKKKTRTRPSRRSQAAR